MRNSSFYNNTVYRNDTHNAGFGQLWIQYASDNLVTNNIFYAAANNVLLVSEKGNRDNTLSNNLCYTDAGTGNAESTWNGRTYGSYSAYRAGTGQYSQSLFGNALFVNAATKDFHLTTGSSAIDGGTATPDRFAPTDFDGTTRPQGTRPDIGAFEATSM